MAELEGRAQAGGKRVEERVEQRHVLLQVRRQLKQQRAELGSEDRRGFEELAHAIGAVAQPRVVGDALWRLERQLELIRGRRVPPLQNFFVRGAIERVVDLDR